MQKLIFTLIVAMFAAGPLTGCGGGGGGSSNTSTSSSAGNTTPTSLSDAEAARFLGQATLGPTIASIKEVQNLGLEGWYADQISRTQTLLQPQLEQIEAAAIAKNAAAGNGTGAVITGVIDVNGYSSLLWATVPQANDQLRQRVALALSEIFVVSFQDNNLKYIGPAMANYQDMLARDAFGNFRQLLQDVTLHPVMTYYLSWNNNKNETYDSTGALVRTPDENYARESMQLFTIGLNQLNPDGSNKLDKNGAPIPTYTHDDIFGIAKVLTGWTNDPSANAPQYATAGSNGVPVIPNKPQNHSTSQKTFLGTTIAANKSPTAASMQTELGTFLDTLFNHPNVGPFFGKQLIQRLVTSNPSPAYISRVASVFNNNGAGVRGDLSAVIHAVLMDPEARDDSALTNPTFGKIKEPIVRYANWIRAFNGQGTGSPAVSGVGSTSDPSSALAQSPLNSSSVFNFYRPGYVPPNTNMGTKGLTVPEMQITNEESVVGYQNFMRSMISGSTKSLVMNTSQELALTEDASIDSLLDRLNLELMQGNLNSSLRATVRDAISSIVLDNPSGTTKGDLERNRRLWTAIYLLMASPEFIVQK